ncbi:hypothetical protein [Tessaracoccus coleopterorum]|uniref:hypothetical protein n=1 Tax=Tessaracoccus coleopterorum TaxID=2714950 RepID=UPI0018D35747|nr:hypothetical protein [Tessaracoccus coleopterorum]
MDLLLKSLIVVVGGVLATWGNPVIRLVLARIDEAGRPPVDDIQIARRNLGLVETQRELPGGRWVGMLERLAVYACIVSGFPAGIAMVLAVKGLGRYAELATSEPASRKGELFIIGTFASLLWAGLWAGPPTGVCGRGECPAVRGRGRADAPLARGTPSIPRGATPATRPRHAGPARGGPLERIAFWFHDAVHTSTSPADELASAELARELLGGTLGRLRWMRWRGWCSSRPRTIPSRATRRELGSATPTSRPWRRSGTSTWPTPSRCAPSGPTSTMTRGGCSG